MSHDRADDPQPQQGARPAGLVEHHVRTALVQLLRQVGAVTANEAARRLGCSSGLCSFHLRQLARAGVVEPAPGSGRAKPWRLVPGASDAFPEAPPVPPPAAAPDPGPARAEQDPGTGPENFACFTYGLEDESFRRWLELRDSAPAAWNGHDQAFSTVAYLAPAELDEIATALRDMLRRYQDREWLPDTRPADAAPVAVISRLFPILPTAPGEESPPGR
ncbi:winged helix-turn-helix domain-containing protein [Streptomyces sp. NBC_01477]|uniref:winged helix-turn-helix domain-containing protein n=1 Tax=Streptomyces sp. NBC_01477 TaxID=2976015 RepID=UPI002E2F9720|nr:winged helix-turn-helix domain-containing protein [Streptomyces sp. NBC_01477]